MNYGDHSFIEITQKTKLRVAVVVSSASIEPVELVVSSESSCAVRQCRHSQNAWARHVERVESSQVEFGLIPLMAQTVLKQTSKLFSAEIICYIRHVLKVHR